ncbi:hypothetical protein ABIA39_003534 [Nocardia sp. GAS34]|uniref:transglycosylase SLT domain-containing protein n=1 Tax=unclassified Nocardia TaxID=2637762 RepID=UPI003D236CB2
MTLTVSDVEKWDPSKLGTASGTVGTTSTSLDTAIGNAYNTIINLQWDGNAAAVARTRMDTEKTRASAVSAALLDLQKALNLHVDQLNNTKKAVLDARDAAIHPTGKEAVPSDSFEVADTGEVTATARKAYFDNQKNLRDDEKSTQKWIQDLLAANHRLAIVGALAQAESAANDAVKAVNDAKVKVDAAYNGLGDPSLGVTVPAPTVPSSVTAPSTANDTSQYTSNGNGTTSHGGTHNSNISYSTPSSGNAPTIKPSGTEKEWIEQAKQILISMGYSPDQINEQALEIIIQGESGGDPNAINNYDSNAAAGHPSKGLMQTIDSTFNQWAAPGHTDIWNPVDNIVAGARYSIGRYGTLEHPGVVSYLNGNGYHGY